PSRRDAGLVALRDRLGLEAADGSRALRLPIHHSGAAPAGEAMARWASQTLHPEEVEVTPITAHAAARLAAGLLPFACYREPSHRSRASASGGARSVLRLAHPPAWSRSLAPCCCSSHCRAAW